MGDPKFVKAYSRKGAAHFWMKEYNKALKAYEDGLKIEPENDECIKGREQVFAKIQKSHHDPQINMFLKEMQNNPKEAQKAMNADPKLQEAVSKLMAAGIIRTG